MPFVYFVQTWNAVCKRRKNEDPEESTAKKFNCFHFMDVLLQCRKANKKLGALTRISKLWLLHKGETSWKLLLNLSLAIPNLFGCFVCRKQTNAWKNYVHERALRSVKNEASPSENYYKKIGQQLFIKEIVSC